MTVHFNQTGGKQHIIPAAHIANFSSNDSIPRKRNRPVFFRRDGFETAIPVKAGNVGYREHIYTIQDRTYLEDERYVDKTWTYVEKKLSIAVSALGEHKGGPTFDGTLWVTVLVPFVAQLFCRGEDFEKLLFDRAPSLDYISKAMEINKQDNTNMNRLIDFQIYCGLLCNAEWRVIHNKTDIPFVLSDLGYTTFNADRFGYGRGKGYFIPISKTLAIAITQRHPINQQPSNVYGNKIMMIHGPVTDKNKVNFFNKRIVKSAHTEAYGPYKEVLDEAWGERAIRRKEAPAGASLIQSQLVDALKIQIHWKWMDLFDIPLSVRKELYGGRVIQVANGIFESNEPHAIVYSEKMDNIYTMVYKEL